MRTCFECGDLQVKFKTIGKKRNKYFCSENHALQFVGRQITRDTKGKYGKYTPDILKELEKSNMFDKKNYFTRL